MSERREYIVEYDCDGSWVFEAKTRERIVRCRDCKHCRRDDSRWYCSELMFDIDWVTSDMALDGFCAWGERRDA